MLPERCDRQLPRLLPTAEEGSQAHPRRSGVSGAQRRRPVRAGRRAGPAHRGPVDAGYRPGGGSGRGSLVSGGVPPPGAGLHARYPGSADWGGIDFEGEASQRWPQAIVQVAAQTTALIFLCGDQPGSRLRRSTVNCFSSVVRRTVCTVTAICGAKSCSRRRSAERMCRLETVQQAPGRLLAHSRPPQAHARALPVRLPHR